MLCRHCDERSREEPAAATRPAPKAWSGREATASWGRCPSGTPGGLLGPAGGVGKHAQSGYDAPGQVTGRKGSAHA